MIVKGGENVSEGHISRLQWTAGLLARGALLKRIFKILVENGIHHISSFAEGNHVLQRKVRISVEFVDKYLCNFVVTERRIKLIRSLVGFGKGQLRGEKRAE